MKPIPTPGLIIRPAVKEDCPAILGLVKELAAFERAPDAVTATVAELESAGFGPQPVWWGFVAEEENEVTGFALYYIRYSTWKGRRMYLEDIYVKEDRRGSGAGRKLMDALFQRAKEIGVSGVAWQVLDWNEAAINFYKKYDAVFDGEWLNVSLEL